MITITTCSTVTITVIGFAASVSVSDTGRLQCVLGGCLCLRMKPESQKPKPFEASLSGRHRRRRRRVRCVERARLAGESLSLPQLSLASADTLKAELNSVPLSPKPRVHLLGKPFQQHWAIISGAGVLRSDVSKAETADHTAIRCCRSSSSFVPAAQTTQRCRHSES